MEGGDIRHACQLRAISRGRNEAVTHLRYTGNMDAFWEPLGVVVGCPPAIGGKIVLPTEESSAATPIERKRLYLARLAATRQLWSLARLAATPQLWSLARWAPSYACEDLDDHTTRSSISNYEMQLLAQRFFCPISPPRAAEEEVGTSVGEFICHASS